MTDSPVDYRPNGEIVLDFESAGTFRLNRPKVRTFRELHGLLMDMREAVQDRSEQIAQLRERLDEDHADTDVIRQEIDRLNIPMFELTWPVLEQMVLRLCDDRARLPDVDDWPSWALDTTLPGEFVNHWRTVPKASGGRSQN